MTIKYLHTVMEVVVMVVVVVIFRVRLETKGLGTNLIDVTATGQWTVVLDE